MRTTWVAIFLTVLIWSGVAPAAECVVLLHGLARTSLSMSRMQQALVDEDFLVANVDYPSRDHSIEDLASIAVE